MCPDPLIRRVAGIVILLSVAMGFFVHPAWWLLTASAGFNLVQSSFTNFCPLERILGFAGVLGCRPRGRS